MRSPRWEVSNRMAAAPKDRASNPKAHGKAAREEQKKRAPKKTRAPRNTALLVRRVLPVLSVILAFVGMVILYRNVFPWIAAVPEPEPTAEEQAVAEDASAEPSYKGVEDPWVESGLFTMGNAELDAQIKAFCDALSVEGSTAAQNAQFVYDSIIWSSYEERTADQKPAGRDWDVALMRNYFSTGNPELGEGGTGDAYEFAAVTAYCLRYFGFEDAIAIPVLKTDDNGNETGSALVLVTNSDGERCVCDPTLSVDGWMIGLDRYDTIVVEEIGQDLSTVESLGFKTKQSEQPSQQPETVEQQSVEQQSVESSELGTDEQEEQGQEEQDYQQTDYQQTDYQESDSYVDYSYDSSDTGEYSDYGY